MPYLIQDDKIEKIANDLEKYYNDAWQSGVKSLFSDMARSNMTIMGSFLDQAKDSFVNLKQKSSDSFTTTFKTDLKLSLSVYCANKGSLKTDLLNVGEAALIAAAKYIPIPGLGAVVGNVVKLQAEGFRKKLHEESINETDKQLSMKSGEELGRLLNNDTDALDFVKQSMTQYQAIGKLINSIPLHPQSFEEAITLPRSVFKIQSAASSLHIAMWGIQQYLSAMQERLAQIESVSKDYIKSVRDGKMKEAVKIVIQDAYTKGYDKGGKDLKTKKYHSIDTPKFETPKKSGGATHLANYVAHATAQGYYDAGRDATRDTFARISKHW